MVHTPSRDNVIHAVFGKSDMTRKELLASNLQQAYKPVATDNDELLRLIDQAIKLLDEGEMPDALLDCIVQKGTALGR